MVKPYRLRRDPQEGSDEAHQRLIAITDGLVISVPGQALPGRAFPTVPSCRKVDRDRPAFRRRWPCDPAACFATTLALGYVHGSPKEARELGWQGVKHSTWLNIDQPVEDVGTLSSLLINNSLGLALSSKR